MTTAFDPEILVLDEWMGAGDAEFAAKAAARMAGYVDRAHMVVLATHNHGLVQEAFNKVAVLEAGKLVFFGDVAEWYGL